MAGTLYTGFLDGVFSYVDGTTPKIIPLQETIENATFNYTGEIQTVRTFGARGTKRDTAACLVGETASFEFSTSNITFGALQLAAATLKETIGGSDSIPVAETFVVPSNGVLNLSTEVSGDGSDIVVADEQGVVYEYTYAAGTAPAPDVVTLETPIPVGRSVTVRYNRVSNSENIIRLGAGQLLPEVGLYGRFFGCPGTLLIHAARCIITPNLSFAVGENPASISWTATVLADPAGVLATIVELGEGESL